MKRLVGWSLVVVSSTILAVVAVSLISVNWNQRAGDICREEAPQAASGYAITWEWDEFAYVCDYRGPVEKSRRVGVTDAFHSGGNQRHRPDR